MPYCTASAQHKDLADVAALEQSYEFCIAVWYQPASSTRRASPADFASLQHKWDATEQSFNKAIATIWMRSETAIQS